MADRPSKPNRTLRVIQGGTGEDPDVTQISPLKEPGVSPSAASGGPGATISNAPPDVGDIVSERYRLERVIGEGGMGRVFLATDLLFAEYEDRHPEVAIKFLGGAFSEHESARLALQRETRKSQQLAHPNIVRVLHFDQHGPHAYMIMEFMSGMPLDDYIARKAPTGLSFEDALPIIAGMAAGLQYIHEQKLVHADFKPNNVFVTEDGSAKVLDLGIARAWEDDGPSDTGTRFNAADLGAMTPAYASCEMFEDLPPDPRDDIYALGCVVYELLTGHHPFNGIWSIKARSQKLKPQPPTALNNRQWRVLMRALAFNRDERLDSAAALVEGLRGDRVRRRRLLAGLTGTAVVALITATVLGTVLVRPPDPVETFITSLTPGEMPPLPPGEAQRVENWLAQAGDYMAFAQEEYRLASLAGAHYLLSGGTDSAYRAYQEVLSRTENETAREGVRDLLSLYADWAEAEQDKGNLEDALWTACQGLAIFDGHPRLNRTRDALRTMLKARGIEAPVCTEQIRSPVPPSQADT